MGKNTPLIFFREGEGSEKNGKWKQTKYIPPPSTLQGKNGRSKKIGQTTQWFTSIHVSGKISALPPRTQKRAEFWNPTKIRKLPETRRFQDLRFFVGFCVFFGGFWRGFAVFFLSRLKRCRHFLAFVSPSPKTCNQSPKIEDQSSI